VKAASREPRAGPGHPCGRARGGALAGRPRDVAGRIAENLRAETSVGPACSRCGSSRGSSRATGDARGAARGVPGQPGCARARPRRSARGAARPGLVRRRRGLVRSPRGRRAAEWLPAEQAEAALRRARGRAPGDGAGLPETLGFLRRARPRADARGPRSEDGRVSAAAVRALGKVGHHGGVEAARGRRGGRRGSRAARQAIAEIQARSRAPSRAADTAGGERCCRSRTKRASRELSWRRPERACRRAITVGTCVDAQRGPKREGRAG
jgi:hypothetical protein